jgi:hypothetical protein
VLLSIGVFLAGWYPKAYGSATPTFNLSLKGVASGGTLVLAKTRNRNVAYIGVQTSPGESAESVVQRLAHTINVYHAEQDVRGGHYDPHWLWVGGYQVNASANTLMLPGIPGNYMTGGTEMGLGIPKPPLSLTCSYDGGSDKIVLSWINPPGGYDFILVNCYWTDFDNVYTERVPGTSTTFTIDRKKLLTNLYDMDFRVFGFRNNIPSNAACVHVSTDGHGQEETYGIPFSCGVAPNWTAWSTAAEPNDNLFEQGEKYLDLSFYNPANALSTKPYYQIMKSPPKAVVQGVYRKFLGLTPGHTYRLTACLTTLDMDSAKGDWSLSLHAAPTPSGKDLNSEQLAGLGALPDGRRGPEAGRISFYGPGNTTRGDSALVFSGKDAPGGFQSSLTLPAGVDTITVWVRFSCSDPNGKVGFSGVKLEDLTAIKNPKSPAQIIAEENAAEVKLLQWIEKTSRESPR